MGILKPNEEQLNQAVEALAMEARKKLDNVVLEHFAAMDKRDKEQVEKFNDILNNKVEELNQSFQSTAESFKTFIKEEIKEQIDKKDISSN